jgi:uroporphyrinogen decarboxylase
MMYSVFALAAFVVGSHAFKLTSSRTPNYAIQMSSETSADPLLLRAARGEVVERVPVWMMRQAGRHLQVYRDLCKTYKTFRERSEIAEVAMEVSLQPWRAYRVDGVILFSDILTPFPGMGIEFDILEKEGPKMKTWTTMEDVNKIKLMDPYKSTPFVAEALKGIKKVIGNEATLLGFVGLPFTLATYMVEGSSSTEYKQIKTMSYQAPHILHAMLDKLADNIGDYAIFQIENGAQVIQVFDSWAGNLSPEDYDIFAAPYQRKVISKIKKAHPEVPTIMYINKSGALLERMVASGVDIVSLDWTVTIEEARARIGNQVRIQGNLDPMVLFAPKDVIASKTEAILKAGGGRNHVMNLGHGIDAHTPEEHARHFVDTVKNYRF